MPNLYIDIGSSFIKYQLGDNNLQKIAFPDAIVKTSVLYEVDISEIISIIKNILDCNNADKVYFSTQMHGYILSDEKFNPVTNYISWRDKRFTLLNEKYPYSISNNAGVNAKDNLAVFSIYSLDKDILSKAKYFDTLGSFVTRYFTNNSLVHITDACASGFYNSLTCELLDIVHDNPYKYLVFPTATKNIEKVGYYNNKEIMVAVGDQQASALGCGLDGNSYLLNTGTTSQLCCISDEFISGDYESRPYFYNKTLCTVTGLTGGATFNINDKKHIFNEFNNALSKLPYKNSLCAVGGLVEHNKQFFSELCFSLCQNYVMKDNKGAIDGLKKLDNNSRKIGIMLSEIPFINMPVLFKSCGYDFFILDDEHGGFDYSTISGIIMNARLCGINIIIRLPNNERKDIIKFMDMGAYGLLLPMTNCVDDIQQVVKYAKYAPIGKRGISTMRAHTLYNPPPLLQYMEKSNTETKIYAQIETIKGVENAEEILAVNGVDGIFIGPNDLSCDNNILNDKNSEYILNVIHNLSELAKKNNKLSGIITSNTNYINKSKQCNINMFCVGSELSNLKNSCISSIKQIIE